MNFTTSKKFQLKNSFKNVWWITLLVVVLVVVVVVDVVGVEVVVDDLAKGVADSILDLLVGPLAIFDWYFITIRTSKL